MNQINEVMSNDGDNTSEDSTDHTTQGGQHLAPGKLAGQGDEEYKPLPLYVYKAPINKEDAERTREQISSKNEELFPNEENQIDQLAGAAVVTGEVEDHRAEATEVSEHSKIT